ncbi:MAG: 5'-deoxynucleotidase [Parasporobacterium sp.]|nr:5'-deoxynucleotidase [Parasporobacterium sp.]
MDNSNFFAILSRMKYVNRWGLMRNARNESLSDHTLDVIFITHALVMVSNTYFEGHYDEGRAVLLAAFHDAPEIITGDLPTPVKYYDPEIKKTYDRVEEAAIDKMLSTLPEELNEGYASLLRPDEKDKELKKFVKAADKLSALIKCIEEEQSGNRDFDEAKASTEKIIEGLNMPEVSFFMEHFLPGYYLTLDKQTE